MQPTKQQLELLKGKCPECTKELVTYGNKPKIYYKDCKSCQGTGKASIWTDKELVESNLCNNCGHEMHIHPRYKSWMHKPKSEHSIGCKCMNPKPIPKYKVGDEIEIFHCQHPIPENAGLEYQHYCEDIIKLKIISETDDKWQVIEVLGK